MFKKPYKLDIGGRTVSFNALGDFEFSLASRTDVPASKIASLVKLPLADLEREAASIRGMERRFIDVLGRSLEEPGRIGALLQEIDEQVFSQDHGWRDIVAALNRRGSDYDDFKKLALVKYVQYLASRQDVVRSIFLDKLPMGQAAAAPEAEGAGEPALKETVIFDVADVEAAAGGASAHDTRLERLPLGETVTVRLHGGREMDLLLSRHRFRLLPGTSFYLLDEGGADYLLRPGRNVVGRLLGNQVVIDASYRDVSRKHLIIEPLDEERARLTDMSSHGTFVPPGHVEPPEAAPA